MIDSKLAVGALLVALAAPATAAEMTAAFTHETGATWQVDLNVINDGVPATFSGFTVYFSEALYADLALIASPAAWDSIVVQPDLGLASAGFLDSALFDRNQPLTAGQSQGGFTVQFTLLGNGAPAPLLFDIVDENYNVLSSGQTAAVPEPAMLVQLLAGIGVLGCVVARRRGVTVGGRA